MLPSVHSLTRPGNEGQGLRKLSQGGTWPYVLLTQDKKHFCFISQYVLQLY